MGQDKELKNLKSEALEQRVAPILVYQEDPTQDPTGSGGGGSSEPAVPDQPGNSDGNRRKLWHQENP